jgi:hypothetical protein
MFIHSDKQDCYCAFCKTPRKIYKKRRINGLNLFAAAVAAVVSMYAVWQEFDPRVIFIYVVYLAFAEVFVQIRWRLNLVCKECGFDPILYMKEPSLAAERVKEKLERRKEDPATLFKPPLQIPKITKERAEALKLVEKNQKMNSKKANRGRLLSKQI